MPSIQAVKELEKGQTASQRKKNRQNRQLLKETAGP